MMLENLLETTAPANPILDTIEDLNIAIRIADHIRNIAVGLIEQVEKGRISEERAVEIVKGKLFDICEREETGLDNQDIERICRITEKQTQAAVSDDTKNQTEVNCPIEKDHPLFEQFINQITQTEDPIAKEILRYFRHTKSESIKLDELTESISKSKIKSIIKKHLTNSRPFFVIVQKQQGKKGLRVKLVYTTKEALQPKIETPKNAVTCPIKPGHPLYTEFQQFYNHTITSRQDREILFLLSKQQGLTPATTKDICEGTSVPNRNTATVLVKKLSRKRPFYVEQIPDPKNPHQKLLFLCFEKTEKASIIPKNAVKGPITKEHELWEQLENFLKQSEGGNHEKIIRHLASITPSIPATIESIEEQTELELHQNSIRRALLDLTDTRPFFVQSSKRKRIRFYLCYEKTEEEQHVLPPETIPTDKATNNPIIKQDHEGAREFMAQFAENKSLFKIAEFIATRMSEGQRTTIDAITKQTGLHRNNVIALYKRFLSTTPYRFEERKASKTIVLQLVRSKEAEEQKERTNPLFTELKNHPSLIGNRQAQSVIDHLSKQPIGSYFREADLAQIAGTSVIRFAKETATLLADTKPVCLVLSKGKYQTKATDSNEETTDLDYMTEEEKLTRKMVARTLSQYEDPNDSLMALFLDLNKITSINNDKKAEIVRFIRSRIAKMAIQLKNREIVTDQVCRRIDMLIEETANKFKEATGIAPLLESVAKKEREYISTEVKFKRWEALAKGQSTKYIIRALRQKGYKIGDIITLSDLVKLSGIQEVAVRKIIQGYMLNSTPLCLKEAQNTTRLSYTITTNEKKEQENGVPRHPIHPITQPIVQGNEHYQLLQETLSALGSAERAKEILSFLAAQPSDQIITYETITDGTNIPIGNITQVIIQMYLDENEATHRSAPFTIKKEPIQDTKRKRITLWCRSEIPHHKTTMRRHPLCIQYLSRIPEGPIKNMLRILIDLQPDEIISAAKLAKKTSQQPTSQETEAEIKSTIPKMITNLANHPKIQLSRYLKEGQTFLGLSLTEAAITEWASATPAKNPERKFVEAILERFFTSRTHPITFTKKEVKDLTGLKSMQDVESLIEILNKTPGFKLIQSPQDKNQIILFSSIREVPTNKRIIE